MKATITQKKGIAVISFEGQLDYAHTPALKDKLKQVYQDKKNKKIMFNFEKLEFVGSSGIKPFVKLLRSFNKTPDRPRYYGVSPEYQRILKALQGRSKFEVFDSEKNALQSYRIYNTNFRKGGRA